MTASVGALWMTAPPDKEEFAEMKFTTQGPPLDPSPNAAAALECGNLWRYPMKAAAYLLLMAAVLGFSGAPASAQGVPGCPANLLSRPQDMPKGEKDGVIKPPEEKTTEGIPVVPQIVQGDPINPEESGEVLISAGGGCSGTLLTNEWAITAQHCNLDTDVPSNITVSMGSQSSVGVFAVGHPSLDFALVKIATPFRMQGSTTGFRMPLYTGATASLSGQVLRCLGYGCNTPGEACTGFGTLREAYLPVDKAPGDDYSFSVKPNARGQTLAPGDSGSGAFARTGAGWALAGVYKGPAYGRPENWREWAMAYVDGKPIPLPKYWCIPKRWHPTFLTPPLPNDYTDAYTWNPCPGGRQYSFTPTFDLESGKDFIALTTRSGAVTLTGTGMTKCTGQGPFNGQH